LDIFIFLNKGGFGGCTDHDSHLLYTLSAIQVLAICDTLTEVDKDKVVECKYYIIYMKNEPFQNFGWFHDII